jgi:hypothetical protein
LLSYAAASLQNSSVHDHGQTLPMVALALAQNPTLGPQASQKHLTARHPNLFLQQYRLHGSPVDLPKQIYDYSLLQV